MTMPRSQLLVPAILLAALTAVTTMLAATAQAQRYDQRRDDRRQHVAGQFDYYTLVLSWSPTYCAGLKGNRYDPQCHAKKARPYAFVLHGLWPQYNRGYPERCWTRDRPFVPRKLINRMLDIMPSPKLVIHEYKKHGTCSGLTPQGYYRLSRELYEKIKIPKTFEQPLEPMMVSRDKLVDQFIAANPKLRPDMLAVSCGGPGNRLREVRICFSKAGQLTPCGRNESQRRLCRAKRMFVPPVRASR